MLDITPTMPGEGLRGLHARADVSMSPCVSAGCCDCLMGGEGQPTDQIHQRISCFKGAAGSSQRRSLRGDSACTWDIEATKLHAASTEDCYASAIMDIIEYPRSRRPDEATRARMSSQEMLGAERLKHLEFIQAVVTRLGTTSFLVKGWTLTIATIFFAVQVDRLSWAAAVSGLIPLLAFWFLDGYFLWQERLFRCLYDDVRRPDSGVELLSMNTAAYTGVVSLRAAMLSRTLMMFYGTLVVVDVALVVAGATTR